MSFDAFAAMDARIAREFGTKRETVTSIEMLESVMICNKVGTAHYLDIKVPTDRSGEGVS